MNTSLVIDAAGAEGVTCITRNATSSKRNIVFKFIVFFLFVVELIESSPKRHTHDVAGLADLLVVEHAVGDVFAHLGHTGRRERRVVVVGRVH